MNRILAVLLVSIVSLLVVACPQDRGDPPADDVAVNDVAVCLQGEPFVAEGAIALDAAEAGDAHRVSNLRWEAHAGCERFVIDLVGEDGSPATSAGEVRAEVLRDLGVVRLSLREVEHVDPDATDISLDGPLARAAYAVWSPEGRWVYVDLHLLDEAEAHVTVLDEPARVVIDLRPGGGALPSPAVANERVVVLEPRPGEAAYPLTVTGYARTFEANVVARIEQEGEPVDETFTTATAWADAWGHYSLTFDEGPAGRIELHVGEHSARDGTWQGVVVELNMR